MSDSIRLYDYDAFQQLLAELKKADQLTAKALNNAVAEVAAKGRRKESEYEETLLRPRSETTKWRNGQKIHGGSLWTNHGYYVAKNRPALRLINFSWENKANINKSFSRKYAKVAVSSQQMNLWAQMTKPYSKQSPPFSSGSGMGFGVWKKGESRPAKLSFSRFRSNVESAMPLAMQIVNSRWQAEINQIKGARA
nr:MAG TPA: hypothetical protein [Caudoviricetes sp.]